MSFWQSLLDFFSLQMTWKTHIVVDGVLVEAKAMQADELGQWEVRYQDPATDTWRTKRIFPSPQQLEDRFKS